MNTNGLELRTNLRVVNLTYSSELSDQRTPAFQYHAFLFCQDMRMFYAKTRYADRFFDCGVDQFTANPVRIHFYLVFRGTDLDGLPDSVVSVIRRFGDPVYYQMYLTYLVGDLLVLPEKLPEDPSVYPTNITVLPTSTMYTSASSSLIDTTPTPTVTAIDTPDGIMLILYYEVYNLTFTYDLRNPESQTFLKHKIAVCDDLWRWYMGSDSPFRIIYRACDLTSFNNDPTGVTFT
ncbi:uncharacterized protein LOC118478548, partial [Aplysia californica]|uniref:Uncharacterized protein LOC118478548 n=1 Tax=Aplysia californica TaxID=6500 RepID=A0ABM1W0P5_APLCA